MGMRTRCSLTTRNGVLATSPESAWRASWVNRNSPRRDTPRSAGLVEWRTMPFVSQIDSQATLFISAIAVCTIVFHAAGDADGPPIMALRTTTWRSDASAAATRIRICSARMCDSTTARECVARLTR